MKDKLLIKFLIAAIVFTFSACQKSEADNINISPSKAFSSPQTPNPISSPALDSPVRKVDFKNFTYPWTEDLSSKFEKTFTLKNGERPYEPHGSMGISLDKIEYVDVTNDTVDEAILTISLQTGGSAMPNIIYIYSLENEKPKLLWSFDTGDRAEGDDYEQGEDKKDVEHDIERENEEGDESGDENSEVETDEDDDGNNEDKTKEGKSDDVDEADEDESGHEDEEDEDESDDEGDQGNQSTEESEEDTREDHHDDELSRRSPGGKPKRQLSKHGPLGGRKRLKDWKNSAAYDESVPFTHRYGYTWANSTSNDVINMCRALRGLIES